MKRAEPGPGAGGGGGGGDRQKKKRTVPKDHSDVRSRTLNAPWKRCMARTIVPTTLNLDPVSAGADFRFSDPVSASTPSTDPVSEVRSSCAVSSGDGATACRARPAILTVSARLVSGGMSPQLTLLPSALEELRECVRRG